MTRPEQLTPEFRALSAKLGQDPLRVQGPGGNTSIKDGNVMWIKASGTELAEAETSDIFIAVDRKAALAEVHGAGDGSCKATVIDPTISLRPSIETTFHAALDWPVVVHTHSVATIMHAISPEGRAAATEKLSDLPALSVPYRKPGLPLTLEILRRLTPETQVIILENHGLICCGRTVAETNELIEEVERRLSLPARDLSGEVDRPAPDGTEWATRATGLATDRRCFDLARTGSYYPDHVVFLGPALPTSGADPERPVHLVEGHGAAIRTDATASQRAMLQCLADVFARLPEDWTVEPIGPTAEADLLNWDAEKYRQALAERS
ncbi:MAG: class II aldolase/adducin family protein [Rhodobacter sp.]|nr:class II aldolase/adducin family protein [Rhodobacter sp.]